MIYVNLGFDWNHFLAVDVGLLLFQHFMSAIYILIGASLIVASLFLIAFFWAVKSNQYEDDYSPSVRMLFDDKPKSDSKNKKSLNIK